MANSEKNPSGQKNEGEGNKTAARHYNKDQHDFAQSGKVDKAAHEAEAAIEGKEGDELRTAEEEGRSHAKDEIPGDYAKKRKH